MLSEGSSYVNGEVQDDLAVSVLERAIDTLTKSGHVRFEEVAARIRRMQESDLDGYALLCSQGVRTLVQWK